MEVPKFDPTVPIAEQMPFETLTVLLDRLQSAANLQYRKREFSKLVEAWRKYLELRHASNVPLGNGDSFFTVCRILMPAEDVARQAYKLKEHRLTKLIIDVMGITKGSVEEKKLLSVLESKTDVDDSQRTSSNLPGAVFEVLTDMAHGPRGTAGTSVWQIEKFLHALSRSDDEIKRDMRFVMNGLTPKAIRWLVAIILKGVTFGLSGDVILSLYHPDAPLLYKFQGDLKLVCDQLEDRRKRLSKQDIQSCKIFTWCQPMLAERVNISKVDNHLKGEEFLIETKYDGERFQLHKSGSLFKYFSKNGYNRFSSNYGESFDEGTLTPALREAFAADVKEIILDGEMMHFDTVNNELVSKGESHSDVKRKKRFKLNHRNDNYEECYVVFDVLYLNGVQLTGLPLRKRLEYLEKAVRPVPGKLAFAQRSSSDCRNSQAVAEALRDVMERGEEGLIVKKSDSVYRPTIRYHGGWIKIKPDFSDELVDTLDLLVMGVDYGLQGNYRDYLQRYVCGVRQVSSDGAVRYLALSVVGSGFNDETLLKIHSLLKPRINPRKDYSPPSNMVFGPMKPAFWLRPEQSVVFSVKASEINSNNDYPLKVSLRFPRFRNMRESSESDYTNCMTADELLALGLGPLGKKDLTADQIAMASDGLPSSKKPRVSTKKPCKVLGADLVPLKKGDGNETPSGVEGFAGKQVCILNAPISRNHEIISSLSQFGAEFTLRPIEGKTHFIVAYKTDVVVQSYIKQNLWDIFTGDWYDKCIATKSFVLPNQLKAFVHATPRTQRVIADKFGNSFRHIETPDELRVKFEAMRGRPDVKRLTRDVIDDLREELGICTSKYHLFNRVNAFFQTKPNDALNFEFVLYGGTVVSDINDSKVTHIVADKGSRDLTDLSIKKRAHLVSFEWITDCIADGKLVDDRSYRP